MNLDHTIVRRVLVWPAVLRVLHWVMAVSVLVLVCTGWLLKSGLVASDQLYRLLIDQLHLPAGYVLGVVVVLRLFYLVSGSGVVGLAAFKMDGNNRQRALETWRFYTTFGRATIPGYYAHNPFWMPLYLVMFLLLSVAAVTGLFMEYGQLRALFGLSSDSVLHWHGAPFAWLSMLMVLHIGAAFAHDLKGVGADVSGMINGHRTFEVSGSADASTTIGEVSVTLDSVGQRSPRDKPGSVEEGR